eukprot:4832532-Amphidinium_carterae.2
MQLRHLMQHLFLPVFITSTTEAAAALKSKYMAALTQIANMHALLQTLDYIWAAESIALQ